MAHARCCDRPHNTQNTTASTARSTTGIATTMSASIYGNRLGYEPDTCPKVPWSVCVLAS